MVALSKFFVTVACMSGVAMAAPSSNAGYEAGLMKRQFGVENTVPSAIAGLGASVAQILARIDSLDVIDPSLIASDIADLQGAYSNSTAALTTASPLRGGVLNPIVFGTTLSFSGTLRSTASALAAVADSGDLSTSIASLDSAIAGTVTQYGTSAPGSAGLLTQSIADSDESFIIAGLNNTHNALGLGQ